MASRAALLLLCCLRGIHAGGRVNLDDLAAPLNLDDALGLHDELLRRTRRVRRSVGVPAVSNAQQQLCSSSGARLGRVAAMPSPTISPTQFGADPTGKVDSTAGVQAAVSALLKQCSDVRRKKSMAKGIADCGGITMDLQGGEYLISEPIVIPPGVGNINLNGGTLRASPNFNTSRWLVELGSWDSCKPADAQGVCNEYINVRELLFDASHVAAGGLRVGRTMGATATSCFFTGFTDVGLRVDGGHEVELTDSWLAEYYWDEKRPASSTSTSVGVQLNGNDHYLTNVVVFDFTKVGVEVNGAANVLTAVHTWNGGGVGIAVNSEQTRLQSCYLDYNYLQVTNPSSLVVVDTFFLDTNAVFVAASGGGGEMKNVLMENNVYANLPSGGSIELRGNFTKASNVRIRDEVGGTVATEVSVAVTRIVPKVGIKVDLSVDFPTLLLPWIDHVQFSAANFCGVWLDSDLSNKTTLLFHLSGANSLRENLAAA